MPDHKPHPWEKPCPHSAAPGCYRHKCCICSDTGVVPMTTAEMLEALAAEAGHVTHSVHLSFNPMRSLESGQWMASVYYGSRRSSVERYGTTPDDALRAALETVTP